MEFIKDQIKRARLLIDDAAKFGFRSFLPILAAGGIPGFIVSAFSEVATAKPAGEGSDLGMGDVESLREQVLQNMDFSRPSESSKLLNELQQSVKNMSNGGIATINNMTRPVGYKMGTREGNLVGDKEKMMKAGILEDADDLRTMTKRFVLLKSLAESYGGKDVLQRMDDIKEMSPVEIEIEYQKLIGLEES